VRKPPPLRARNPTPTKPRTPKWAAAARDRAQTPTPTPASPRGANARRIGPNQLVRQGRDRRESAAIVRKAPPLQGFVRKTPPPPAPVNVRKPPPLRALSPTPSPSVREPPPPQARPIMRQAPPPRRRRPVACDRGALTDSARASPPPPQRKQRRSCANPHPPLGPRTCANSHPQVRETPPLRAPNATLFSTLTARLPVLCGSKRTARRTRIVPRGESGGLPEGRAPGRSGRCARPAPPAPASTMPAGHTDTAAGAAHRG